MRRVVASSPSRSGKSAAAGAGLELDAVAVADRLLVVVFFLAADPFLLADLVFLEDLLDFFAIAERLRKVMTGY